MRRVFFCLFLFALVAAPLSARAADGFVPGIDDLPLMPGLAAVQDEAVVFDVPGGRIVEAWAEGAATRDAIRSFYGTALPQLGWRAASPDLFRREGESLRLEFPTTGPRGAAAAGRVLVRFYLSPG
jgi:hypothetical protein